MSPTVFREKDKRYFFFSREETRMHVHVSSPKGEAKFWLEPIIALAKYVNFSERELKDIQNVIEGRSDEIRKAWKEHFTN